MLQGVCHDRLKWCSGHRRRHDRKKTFPCSAYCKRQSCLRVVQRKSFRYRLDCFGQGLLHRLSINDVFPKDIDGVDHPADLVTTVAMADIDIGFSGRKALHHIGNGFYRPYDRSADDKSDKGTDQNAGKRYFDNEMSCSIRQRNKARCYIIACGVRNCRRQILDIGVDGLECVVRLAEHHRCHGRVGLANVDRVLRLIFTDLPLGQQPLHGGAFQAGQIGPLGKSGNAVGCRIEI